MMTDHAVGTQWAAQRPPLHDNVVDANRPEDERCVDQELQILRSIDLCCGRFEILVRFVEPNDYCRGNTSRDTDHEHDGGYSPTHHRDDSRGTHGETRGRRVCLVSP
jgi:hypothetical protein